MHHAVGKLVKKVSFGRENGDVDLFTRPRLLEEGYEVDHLSLRGLHDIHGLILKLIFVGIDERMLSRDGYSVVGSPRPDHMRDVAAAAVGGFIQARSEWP